MNLRGALALSVGLIASPAAGQAIEGTGADHGFAVSDGDTVRLNGTSYRLWGIDAPELHQTCGDYWPAGIQAQASLKYLIRGRKVECESRGYDRYGRTIAICRADGEDLSRTMVEVGMAWAFTKYSRDYVEQEKRARMENLGIHAYQCLPAWEWRALGQRLDLGR